MLLMCEKPLLSVSEVIELNVNAGRKLFNGHPLQLEMPKDFSNHLEWNTKYIHHCSILIFTSYRVLTQRNLCPLYICSSPFGFLSVLQTHEAWNSLYLEKLGLPICYHKSSLHRCFPQYLPNTASSWPQVCNTSPWEQFLLPHWKRC